MALPKLNTPKYKMKLPSTGKVVNYRPFLVKEEKLLLIATETGDQDEIIAAITNIIKECTDLTDINKLPTFDIEYVFLQIRTKSVGLHKPFQRLLGRVPNNFASFVHRFLVNARERRKERGEM